MPRPDEFWESDLNGLRFHEERVIASAWMFAVDDCLRSRTAKFAPLPPVIRSYLRCRIILPDDAKPDVATTLTFRAKGRSEFGIQTQKAVNFGINIQVDRTDSVRDFPLRNSNVAVRKLSEVSRIIHRI